MITPHPPRQRLCWLGLALLLVIAPLTSTAKAAELSDAEVQERLAHIEASLTDGKVAANVWWWGWIAVQVGSAGVYGALAIADHHSPETPVNAVTAGVAAISAGALLAIPMVPAYAPSRLRKLPEDTPEARRLKLAAAEDFLRRSAEYEEQGRGWLAHALNFGVAAAAGLLLAFAFEATDWRDGLYNFILLAGVGELQVATQPTQAIRDWKAYQRDFLLPPRSRPQVAVTVFAAPFASAVSLTF